MTELLEKVTALILRSSAIGHDLLLCEHRSAGIQIPAGTVEPDEAPRDAVLRETCEATGLMAVAIQRDLGFVDTHLPNSQRAIRGTTPSMPAPVPPPVVIAAGLAPARASARAVRTTHQPAEVCSARYPAAIAPGHVNRGGA